MQRWCSKLRSVSVFLRATAASTQSSPPLFLLHSSRSSPPPPLPYNRHSQISSILKPSSHLSFDTAELRGHDSLVRSPQLPHNYLHMRNFSAKSKEKKWKKITPATSKMKKTKMKAYSSFKDRFRTMKDGNIRRWRAGKRHNAHLKSKKSKRRLRKPAIVPLAYAKVMKKLNFCA